MDLVKLVMSDPDMEGCDEAANFLFIIAGYSSLNMVKRISRKRRAKFLCPRYFLEEYYSPIFVCDQEKKKRIDELRVNPGEYRLPIALLHGIDRIIYFSGRKEKQARFLCGRPESKIKIETLNIEPICCPQELCDCPGAKIKSELLNIE